MSDENDIVTLIDDDARDRPPHSARVEGRRHRRRHGRARRHAFRALRLCAQRPELRVHLRLFGRRGRELLAQPIDIAVVLLDVVMETDSAGLELVDFIRKELRNETVRIILRTGQPGPGA